MKNKKIELDKKTLNYLKDFLSKNGIGSYKHQQDDFVLEAKNLERTDKDVPHILSFLITVIVGSWVYFPGIVERLSGDWAKIILLAVFGLIGLWIIFDELFCWFFTKNKKFVEIREISKTKNYYPTHEEVQKH